MVNTVRQFFKKYIKASPEQSGEVSEHALQIATAALLIETMRADTKVEDNELETLRETVRSKFALTEEETHALLNLAEKRIWQSTGFYEFTAIINKSLAYEQRLRIIEQMWEIALSDAQLDKYEEHLVRRVADLIHVTHRDFISAKLRVRRERST